MEANRPRCFDDLAKANRAVGYDTSEVRNPGKQPIQSNIYPNIPRGETTPRPSAPRPNYGGQPTNYQGGRIGSGYPGAGGHQQPAYPNYQGGAYPNYPQQGYPGNYPTQSRGGYQGGYPQQGYPQGYPTQSSSGYPQQYPNYNNYYQNGYNPYNNPNRYATPQKSGASQGGIVDKLTEALKSYGTDLLKNAIKKQIAGN